MLVLVSELERCQRLAAQLRLLRPIIWADCVAFTRYRSVEGAQRLRNSTFAGRAVLGGQERLVADALVQQLDILLTRGRERPPTRPRSQAS